MAELVPVVRADGRLKVTGGARYTADVPVERLAHAVLVGSTIASGRITRIGDLESTLATGSGEKDTTAR